MMSIFTAIVDGDINQVKTLLDQGQSSNQKDGNNDTPLHIAVQYNQRGIIKLLLTKNADPNAIGNTGGLPLGYILCVPPENRVEITKDLLDRGADPNHPNLKNGSGTLLHRVASFESKHHIIAVEMARLLLDKHAQVNAMGIEGSANITPLYYAAKFKNVALINLFLEHGAESITTINMLKQHGSPLDLEMVNFIEKRVRDISEIKSLEKAFKAIGRLEANHQNFIKAKQAQLENGKSLLSNLANPWLNEFMYYVNGNIQKNLPYDQQLALQHLHSWIKIAEGWNDDITSVIVDFSQQKLSEIRECCATNKGINIIKLDIDIIQAVLKTPIARNNSDFIKFSTFSQQVLQQYATNTRALEILLGNSDNNNDKELANKFNQFSKQMSKLAHTLYMNIDNEWSQVEKLSLLIAESTNSQINSTVKKLFEAITTINQPSKLLDSVTSSKPNLTQEEIQYGMELFSIVLSPIDAKLANKIATIGQASITIASTIASFSAIAAASGPAAPYVLIGGAVITILNELGVFGSSDSSPEHAMLKQIQILAQQVNDRFDRVDKSLQVIRQEMHSRFDRLEGIIINGFKRLGSNLDEVKAITTEIQQQVQQLDKKLQNIAINLYQQPYGMTRSRALDLKYRTNDKPEEYASDFIIWGTIEASNPLVSGDSHCPDEQLVKNVLARGIEFNINSLIGYVAQRSKDFQNPGPIANPQLWADSARQYMLLINRQPALKAVHKHIDDLIKMGEKIIGCIKDIQKDKEFFTDLIKDYQACLNNVIETYANRFDMLDEYAKKLTDQLTNLNMRHQLLTIYSIFVFNSEYYRDSNLKYYLQLYLWTGDDFKSAFEEISSEERTFNLHHAKKAFKEFEKLMVDKLEEANNQNKLNYPLIDNVLEELKIFKSVYLAKSKSEYIPQVESAWKKDFKEITSYYDEVNGYYGQFKLAYRDPSQRNNPQTRALLQKAKDGYKFLLKKEAVDKDIITIVDKRINKLKDPTTSILKNKM